MQRRREGEKGFAVLMIFVMAATIAIYLYMQLPRAAFESQRNKEETLIQRGEQYQRAIQLYYRRFRKYPASLQDLENTNNIRFLRHKYVDPMTGKDEWRLIHITGPGVYTDSLTRKPPTQNGQSAIGSNSTNGSAGSSAITSTGFGGTPTGSLQPQTSVNPQQTPGTQPGNTLPPLNVAPIAGLPDPNNLNNPTGQGNNPSNPALRRRPSDRPGAPGSTPAPTDPNGNPTNPNGTPTDPNQQPQLPGVGTLPPIVQPGMQPQPGTGNQPNGQQPYNPTTQQPNLNGATPIGNTPAGAQGQVTGNGQGAQPTNAGAMIFNQLTRPNPQAQQIASGQGAFGAGIAGVASKYEAEGIKVYGDRSKYNEWEFIYDPAKEAAAAMGNMMGGQQQGLGGNNNSNFGNNPQPAKP